mgnify:FL=1|jgi:hypothetical protein
MKLPNWVKEFIQVGLLLDARAAVEVAPEVGSIVAKELGQDDEWADRFVESVCKSRGITTSTRIRETQFCSICLVASAAGSFNFEYEFNLDGSVQGQRVNANCGSHMAA